jgi:hypothetical protein
MNLCCVVREFRELVGLSTQFADVYLCGRVRIVGHESCREGKRPHRLGSKEGGVRRVE